MLSAGHGYLQMLPDPPCLFVGAGTYTLLLGVLRGAALLSDRVCVCSPTTHGVRALSGCLTLGIVSSCILAVWWVSSGRKLSMV